MKKLLVLFAVILCLLEVPAWAGTPGSISLTVGQNEAWLGESQVLLDTSPLIINGTTMVPLRFIGESMGSTVEWQRATGEITLTRSGKKIVLGIGRNTATINGETKQISVPPALVKGRTMVPLRFIAEVFGCQVDYRPETKGITIQLPNSPPKAKFGLEKDSVSVGEAVTYQDLSSDPDGDQIVNWEWTGREDSFDQPGIYEISLRVQDSRGAWSEPFTSSLQVVGEVAQKPVAQFSLSKESVIIGESVAYTDESYAPDGQTITDRVWENKMASFPKAGFYEVRLRVRSKNGVWSDWFSKTIEVKEKPNQAPLAHFSVNKIKVSQGETVIFHDESSDPDGDAITEYKWTGRQRAYFKEGNVAVTLQVKDKRGMWSEPFSVTIQVTSRVLMTELQYNLFNPLPGETVNLTGINVFSYPKLDPVASEDDGATLLFSNSPETVDKSGLLYRDTASGQVRLMYSHKNGSVLPKKFFILAYNPGTQTVTMTQTKRGMSGPSADELTTGQAGLMRYLKSNDVKSFSIAPGAAIVLERGGDGNPIYWNQCVYGMSDLVTSGPVTFYFIMGDSESQVLAHYREMPALDKDIHQRGTFASANRVYHLEINDRTPHRFIFGDNIMDRQLSGIDALTGERVVNKGNYGLVYNVRIHTHYRLGLLTNPRGGVFHGAGILPDGTVYGIPASGVISDGSKAVMNMILESNQSTDFLFVPPAASNMPVSLLMIPF